MWPLRPWRLLVGFAQLGEPRQAQEDGRLLLLLLGFDPGDLVFGAGEAGGQSFDFAEPSFAFGFGDPVLEVVADLFETGLLVRRDDQDRAADAGVFVDAVGSVGSPAGRRVSRRAPDSLQGMP